ncbi:phospho-2-dehydro-3-deoxyheptonate aldolase [Umbelopsis sp. AD052]|nr:phospho-2-dehydro-3-deoxyheptonate aldolase [Umbelopsis sp. AD052]
MSKSDWSINSWKSKPVLQDVVYEDQAHLETVLKKLQHLPPMVTPKEVDDLRQQLKEAALGKRFLLQGGDCAELFDYCSQSPIESKLKVLLQMSLVLIWGARTPVVRIARMAGQYAKPRSKPTEMHEGKEIPSYRGDNVNGFDPSDRKPDPERLLQAYFHSAATLNYVRAILGSGFADLHKPQTWNLDHVRSGSTRQEYQAIVDRLTDAMDFMQTIGADSGRSLSEVDWYTSHEGLLLDYESSLTREHVVPSTGEKKYYNTGAHFLWIGDRTRQPEGGHVEYMKGIENPVGIKVGPTTNPDDLPIILDAINPTKDIGKVTLITRYGAGNVEKLLPAHIEAVRKSGHIVVWVCDPMHGNTKSATGGIKTRHFADIVEELTSSFKVHESVGSKLNGVHFELTECVGGSMELKDSDLSTNYQTYCDPRLNYEQSLDVAFLIAQYYEKERSLQN